MPQPPPTLLSSPATLRNRGPIAEVLRPVLPSSGTVLEIAAGTGEHAVAFARAFPSLRWLPSERDEDALASIAAREAEGPPNLLPPIRVDAARPETWPEEADGPLAAVFAANMIHISPWDSAEGLFAGASARLAEDGALILYGPFFEADVPDAPSNRAFDLSLRSRDPAWGVRRLEAVDALAASCGLIRAGRYEMPANNLTVVYRRG